MYNVRPTLEKKNWFHKSRARKEWEINAKIDNKEGVKIHNINTWSRKRIASRNAIKCASIFLFFFFRFGVFNCLFKEACKQTQVQHAPRSWELIVYFKVYVEVRGELFFIIIKDFTIFRFLGRPRHAVLFFLTIDEEWNIESITLKIIIQFTKLIHLNFRYRTLIRRKKNAFIKNIILCL